MDCQMAWLSEKLLLVGDSNVFTEGKPMPKIPLSIHSQGQLVIKSHLVDGSALHVASVLLLVLLARVRISVSPSFAKIILRMIHENREYWLQFPDSSVLLGVWTVLHVQTHQY